MCAEMRRLPLRYAIDDALIAVFYVIIRQVFTTELPMASLHEISRLEATMVNAFSCSYHRRSKLLLKVTLGMRSRFQISVQLLSKDFSTE